MIGGVVLVDKPRGPTSFDVVAEVRRRFSEKRVGHTGTLDPMATGLLPVCLGEACKLVPFLTDCDKRYEAEVVFGVGTATADAEGAITERRDASQLDPRALDEAARQLVGRIDQVPPMYSAIRIDGQRLHELAREGKEVERAARPVAVYSLSLNLIERGEAARYKLEIHCGKGTYVRVIAEDLGRLVGLPAHLSALRRTEVGGFTIDRALPLSSLSKATPLIGLADAISHLPARMLDAEGCRRVRAGQERWLFGMTDPPPEGKSRLLGPDGELVAVIVRAEENGAQKIRFLRVFVDNHPLSKAHTPQPNTSQENG